jgi:hypothetical protein
MVTVCHAPSAVQYLCSINSTVPDQGSGIRSVATCLSNQMKPEFEKMDLKRAVVTDLFAALDGPMVMATVTVMYWNVSGRTSHQCATESFMIIFFR